jgi:hypothetical protein
VDEDARPKLLQQYMATQIGAETFELAAGAMHADGAKAGGAGADGSEMLLSIGPMPGDQVEPAPASSAAQQPLSLLSVPIAAGLSGIASFTSTAHTPRVGVEAGVPAPELQPAPAVSNVSWAGPQPTERAEAPAPPSVITETVGSEEGEEVVEIPSGAEQQGAHPQHAPAAIAAEPAGPAAVTGAPIPKRRRFGDEDD